MSTMVTMMLLLRRRKKALEQKRKRQRRFWVHPLISQRLSIGHFSVLFRDLRKNPEKFFSYTRMSVDTFDALLEVLRPRLMKMTTNMRKSIAPEERLIVTLRYSMCFILEKNVYKNFLPSENTSSLCEEKNLCDNSISSCLFAGPQFLYYFFVQNTSF